MVRVEPDRAYSELAPWLPTRILDCHVHVGRAEHCGPISDERAKQFWTLEIGVHQTWAEMRDSYRTLFPDREVSVLAFGFCINEVDFDRENEYVLAGLRNRANKAAGLYITRPEWSPSRIADAMAHGFLGIKPHPDVTPQDTSEVSLYDFVPREHLRLLDEHHGILMMHLPRAGRLADPDNIRELLDINDDYPRIKLIVAHIGRAYGMPNATKGLPHFTDRPGIYFDTAAHLNADVFEYALEVIGTERILFGSDLPVTLMRGYREHVGDKYINNTDGSYSWNINRKSPEEEACYTYYIYEEIKALIRAVERLGLGTSAMEKILFSNAAALMGYANTQTITDAR